MASGDMSQTIDRVLVHVDEAGGLADAAALGDVVEDGEGFVVRQMGMLKRRAFPLGEIAAANAAIQETDSFPMAAPAVLAQISRAAFPVFGALFILTAELFDGPHGFSLLSEPVQPQPDTLYRRDRPAPPFTLSNFQTRGKIAALRKSRQSVPQNRSILPRVWGCRGRETI